MSVKMDDMRPTLKVLLKKVWKQEGKEAGELEMIRAATWGSWRQESDAGGCRPVGKSGRATWNQKKPVMWAEQSTPMLPTPTPLLLLGCHLST